MLADLPPTQTVLGVECERVAIDGCRQWHGREWRRTVAQTLVLVSVHVVEDVHAWSVGQTARGQVLASGGGKTLEEAEADCLRCWRERLELLAAVPVAA